MIDSGTLETVIVKGRHLQELLLKLKQESLAQSMAEFLLAVQRELEQDKMIGLVEEFLSSRQWQANALLQTIHKQFKEDCECFYEKALDHS